MSRRSASEAFGLFDSEREILDLYDAGQNATSIARQLNKRPNYVSQVIDQYGDVGFRDIDGEQRIIRSSKALADAIRATGKSFA